MKITKLIDSCEGEHYKLNSTKSRMFAHSGASYWNTYLKLSMRNRDFDLWDFMYVGLPIMHMALELIIKAFVTFYDSNYNPKSDNHKTSEIIKKYKRKIDALKSIDDQKMEFIKTLELAWEGLRYAECGLGYDSSDDELFNEIMKLLTDEYKKISGLRSL